MSRSHLLAMLPLFSILSMAPMHVETNFASRSIASEVLSSHPKYEARAAKIDRTKIVIDKDLDLSCFSERGEAFRNRLLKERKDYKVDVVEKDAVAAQKARLNGLVSGLVDLEVDMAALKDKKAWDATGEEIANKTMGELKTTLESLLQDEIENELAVLKDKVKKEEAAVVVKEEPKVEKEEEPLCDLEEKNKVLSKQVEDLLVEQKKIMETMLGMSNMMIQMNQRMQNQYQPQQQYVIPSWLMQGSMVNPQLQYPYFSSPTIIMMGNSYNQPSPLDWSNSSLGGQQLGQQNYQQIQQSSQYQYQQPFQPGNFGSSELSFNFGPSPFQRSI